MTSRKPQERKGIPMFTILGHIGQYMWKHKFAIVSLAIAAFVVLSPHTAWAAAAVNTGSITTTGSSIFGDLQANLITTVGAVFAVAVIAGVIVALFNSNQAGGFVQHIGAVADKIIIIAVAAAAIAAVTTWIVGKL